MIKCPMCKIDVVMTSVCCRSCGIQMQGSFQLPRLARLDSDSQKLVEAFILSGGNLKELATQLEVSYPTLRKRLDELIATLQTLKSEDKKQIDGILANIEKGQLTPEEGMRKIKEINGEL